MEPILSKAEGLRTGQVRRAKKPLLLSATERCWREGLSSLGFIKSLIGPEVALC
jgi:hypothetical protein